MRITGTSERGQFIPKDLTEIPAPDPHVDSVDHAGRNESATDTQRGEPSLTRSADAGRRQFIRTPLERRLRRAAAFEPPLSRPLGTTAAASSQAPTLSAANRSNAMAQRARPSPPAAAEAAVLERLHASITRWVDEDKARAYASRPSELMRAVAKHRHVNLPDTFAKTLDVSLFSDEGVLDEAAVLYARLQRPTASAAASLAAPPGDASLSVLRARFTDALRADYAKRPLLDALFVPQPTFGQTTPYFDGFALRNVEGSSFDDLVESKAVWSAPALASLTTPERRALLTEKFEEMAESTRFPIGSIPHSMATALLRMDLYRGAAPSVVGDESALVKAFVRRETAWKDGQSYPYHPRLLFAMHLARSSAMEVLSHEQLRLLFENHVSDPASERMAAGDDAPARWLDSYLSRSSKDGSRWKEAAPAEQTEVLLGLFDALREAADKQSPISPFARDLRAKGVLTPNRIFGADIEAREAAVLAYANERLLAAYGAPPVFDRREAARDILLRNGVDQDAVSDTRSYTISGDNANLNKQAFGDLVDEFLDRADWVGLNGAWMRPRKGVSLKPRDELQRAEEAFNAELPSNPWVVATAKERLRSQSKRPTAAAVQGEADKVATGLLTETESHRALERGLDTWLNTIPIVGPVYNIEEGVRHRDAARAAFGLLFLGVDLFDISAGAGGGLRSEGVHPIVPKLRRVAGRIDASNVNLAGQPEMIEMAADPAHIGKRDANVPAPLRPLAKKVREGASVRWRNYDVVHLDEEDRIVPIRREGDRYVEVDWRTGHRLRDAPTIERDERTRKAHARRIETHGEDRAAQRDEAHERLTVQGVTRLLERANDATVLDFDEAFADAFALPSPASANTSHLNAPAFYRKVYESSSTFRRLFNRHAQFDGRARNGTEASWKKWEFVIGNAGPLGSPRKAYTDFMHKRIYLPDDAGIESTPYMSASGRRTMHPEQAYMGEMVRALTGAADPAPGLDLTNRGPAVYLTGKILSEAGYDFPEQIMFRAENARPDAPIEQTVEYHAQAAARGAEFEDRYLDAIVDAHRGAVTAQTLVEGEPVASRLTVVRTKAVLDAIENDEDTVFLTWGDFKTKFHENFGFYVQDRSMTSELASDAMVVMDFYGRLYQQSATFRRMFDEMPAIDAAHGGPWKFVLEGDIEFDLLSPGSREHGVTEPAKKIYVLDDGLRYLSEAGLRDVEFERKLTHQMICAMADLKKLPPAQAIANRGAAVYLTDKILTEAGFHFPRQLVAALTGPDDVVAHARLLARQTSAMRSAATEDLYLILA